MCWLEIICTVGDAILIFAIPARILLILMHLLQEGPSVIKDTRFLGPLNFVSHIILSLDLQGTAVIFVRERILEAGLLTVCLVAMMYAHSVLLILFKVLKDRN